MSKPNTLTTMDDNEFLGKVDELFEWLARQAGEGPIEAWMLAGLQTEIRRRIMEGHAAVVIEPEPEKITIEMRSVRLKPELPGDAPFSIAATAYCITLRNQKSSTVMAFCSLRETQAFLKGLEAAESFGLLFEAIPRVPAEIY